MLGLEPRRQAQSRTDTHLSVTMPREVVSLHVGQCGNQIGSEFWKRVRHVEASHCNAPDSLWRCGWECMCAVHANKQSRPHCCAMRRRRTSHLFLNLWCHPAAAQLCQEHALATDGTLEESAAEVHQPVVTATPRQRRAAAASAPKPV